jgi:hypothetical protein
MACYYSKIAVRFKSIRAAHQSRSEQLQELRNLNLRLWPNIFRLTDTQTSLTWSGLCRLKGPDCTPFLAFALEIIVGLRLIATFRL